MPTTVDEVVNYVLSTPYNTNKAILTEMLNDLEGTGTAAAPDGKTLIIGTNGSLELYGFSSALPGQIPVKGDNGYLVWKDVQELIGQINLEDLGQEEPVIYYGGSASDFAGG